VTAGEHLYAIGGFSPPTMPDSFVPPVSTVERYSPRSNTWQTVASMNRARSLPGVVALRRGSKQFIVVVAGGSLVGGNPMFLRSTEIYDLQTDRWGLIRAELPRGRVSLVSAKEADGTVLAMGGAAGNIQTTRSQPARSRPYGSPTWTSRTDRAGRRPVQGREPCGRESSNRSATSSSSTVIWARSDADRDHVDRDGGRVGVGGVGLAAMARGEHLGPGRQLAGTSPRARRRRPGAGPVLADPVSAFGRPEPVRPQAAHCEHLAVTVPVRACRTGRHRAPLPFVDLPLVDDVDRRR